MAWLRLALQLVDNITEKYNTYQITEKLLPYNRESYQFFHLLIMPHFEMYMYRHVQTKCHTLGFKAVVHTVDGWQVATYIFHLLSEPAWSFT